MDTPSVKYISECFVKPKYVVEEAKKPLYLPPSDLARLSIHYIQKGLFFAKPSRSEDQDNFMETYLEKLRHSLSLTLVHFYPLSGRLATLKKENPHFYTIYVDCINSPGARFIYTTLDMTISDILSPTYVPVVVQSFFDHDRAINHDGHTMALLSIQVTELVDGVFIGCSMNHAVGDGTSYWNFFNSWSEIFQSLDNPTITISRMPVLERWFPEDCEVPVNLPFTHPSEFVEKYEAPYVLERMFHFSPETITKLKARANSEYNTTKISSFQSLIAFVWRSITRARCFPPNKVTSCKLTANDRPRLNPPLSPNYFGNSISPVRTSVTVGELLEHDLGWAAWILHSAVVNHTDQKVKDWHKEWLKNPQVNKLGTTYDPDSIMLGSSPRFSKYGCQFGLGKALALRSGYANKSDGKVSLYPGREGGGSIDLEICLRPETMARLESDEEFMAAVTFQLAY